MRYSRLVKDNSQQYGQVGGKVGKRRVVISRVGFGCLPPWRNNTPYHHGLFVLSNKHIHIQANGYCLRPRHDLKTVDLFAVRDITKARERIVAYTFPM